tara:strand:+ start:419 stop:679 length:261 start_codon:yes stop_codon:yes gene_type:complete
MLQLFADGLLFIIQQVLGEEQIATEGEGEGEHTMLGVGTGHPITVGLCVLHATIDGLEEGELLTVEQIDGVELRTGLCLVEGLDAE